MYHTGQMSSTVSHSVSMTFLWIYVCRKQLPLSSVSSLSHKAGTFPYGSKESRCPFSLSAAPSQERSDSQYMTRGKDTDAHTQSCLFCYRLTWLLLQSILPLIVLFNGGCVWSRATLRLRSMSNMLLTCSCGYWPFGSNLSEWKYSLNTYYICTNLVKK